MSEDLTHIEEELLLRVATGDEKAFTQLLVETSGLLYSFILRQTGTKEVAEEIVQDVFTQIWQTRESLAEIKNFRAYLYVISRNRMINEIKKIVRERKHHQQWTHTVLSSHPQQDDPAVTEQQYNLIDAAINELPPQQKKVWLLSRRKKMSYNEVAAEMNISRETVKTYLQHANNAITKYISTHADL